MVNRCANPLRNEGVKGYVGKNLRFLSAVLKQKFPDLPNDAKICDLCRKKASQVKDTAGSVPAQQDISLPDSRDEAYHLDEPEVKRFRLSSPSTSKPNSFPGDISNPLVQLSEDEAQHHTMFASSILSVGSCSELMNVACEESTKLQEDKAECFRASLTLSAFTRSLSMEDDASVSSSELWRQSDSENVQTQNSQVPASSREADLETMLDGLKEKFKDPSTSDSDRMRILTTR